jgi:competence protein ComFB
MKLKNYQEDIVLNIIRIVAADRSGLDLTDALAHDVAAYTLNRIPPKYIMSERGFTRMASEHWVDEGDDAEGLPNLVELMLLVNKAMDVVLQRRAAASGAASANGHAHLNGSGGEVEYWHNFPQFIGKVVDSNSQRPIYNAKVSLFIDGERSEPAEPGWSNPTATNEATRGFFSFWPRSMRSLDESVEHDIVISISHDDYTAYDYRQLVETSGEFRIYNYIHGDGIINLETCQLETVASH